MVPPPPPPLEFDWVDPHWLDLVELNYLQAHGHGDAYGQMLATRLARCGAAPTEPMRALLIRVGIF